MIPEENFSDPVPFVSIIVISKDRRMDLKKAVVSLKQLDYPVKRYEIVVVEEGDIPNPVEGARYVYLPRRSLGLGYARNMGVKSTQGEIIAFTDDDCLHDKQWLTKMVKTLMETNAGGVAGATLVQPGGLIGKCEEIMGFPGGGLKRVLKAKGLITKTNLLSGCNCAYKRLVFEDFQFKEDGFGKLGGDDWLLGLQVSEKYSSYFNPEAVVYHKPRNNLLKIAKWFSRRRINELLSKEEKSGKKGIRILIEEFKSLISLRLFSWIGLTVSLGFYGFLIGLAGLLLIMGIVIVRHFPGIKYYNDFRLVLILPLVKLSMDAGILKAELLYLFFSGKILNLQLEEYNR